MDWSVIGINYQKANLKERQKYALNEDQIVSIYDELKSANINQALIISTCNRTEFFLPTQDKAKAIEVVKQHIYGDVVETELFHCLHDERATLYFFRICSGLESQISGDFEILGQVRKACALAKRNGMISGTWERTINNALGASKKARTQTGFYSGASSTSYACIEYLRKADIDLKNSKYLILGAGKIGGHTVDHLLKIAPAENITVSNRSIEKAEKLADGKGLAVMPFEQVSASVQAYDVIICATNAPKYILNLDQFQHNKKQHIVDLSVPMNVDPNVANESHIELVNVDELSVMINENLQKREAEKENVEMIIEESIQDLNAWFTIKSGIPMLAELKQELTQLKKEALSNVNSESREHSEEFLDEYTDELFNQLSQQWIKKVRNKAVNAD